MWELKVRLMERMLGGELTAHLGSEAAAGPPSGRANRRNGSMTKRVKGQDGEKALCCAPGMAVSSLNWRRKGRFVFTGSTTRLSAFKPTV